MKMNQYEITVSIWVGLCTIVIAGAIWFWAGTNPVPTHKSGKAWYIESENLCMMEMTKATMMETRSMAAWCRAQMMETEITKMAP